MGNGVFAKNEVKSSFVVPKVAFLFKYNFTSTPAPHSAFGIMKMERFYNGVSGKLIGQKNASQKV